jgi:hypothetical protein
MKNSQGLCFISFWQMQKRKIETKKPETLKLKNNL